ncbi:MAG TPA: metal ABC transporter substrate-binding protein, partial [Terrimicrobiaceae bacterium]|nr:metal ABC transporter substrate-binding protein [Terrimicrobiaceae bacterium]
MKLAFALVLAAGLATVRAEDKLTVASLSTVLSDVAKHVGGDKIDLIQIVKPGIDPHDFEPTPSDVRAISKAQIVLASGLGFEGYLSKLEQSVGSGPKFVIAGQAIKPIMGFAGDHDDHEGHSHSHGQADESGKTPDPHWFHSVRNIEIVTNLLRDAFIAADPANQAAYTANAKAYQDRLEALSKWVRLQVAQL